ncbi:hypothetical protein DID88_002493 [Monilinia fructigena]|uniref:Glycosyl hydrolase family 13 catalytic domain-containing protein n=1 Tax=Monilinia fructigena TaxID=38457 RepID=A0A395IQ32_9HELO|nr:hypothetical protein DID88_002493 [Monilinia fructigena]
MVLNGGSEEKLATVTNGGKKPSLPFNQPYVRHNGRLGTSLYPSPQNGPLKFVMDLVVNHTSSEHPWFRESVSGGPHGPKRDYYYWQPPKNGKEPNNWGAMFGGSAWEADPSHQTDEYYLHVYDTSQPDLNWTNPAVRNEVWDIMRFWLDKGCDGFRMDVINCISKEPGFPDFDVTDPRMEFQFGIKGNFNGPHVKDYLEEMHREVLCHYPEAFTVGETPGIHTPNDAIGLVQGGKPLQMIFNFEHYLYIKDRKLAQEIVDGGKTKSSGIWRRLISFAAEKARREKESNGKEVDMTDVSRGIQGYGRDNSRMGMQWDDSLNGGFSKGKPWIKTNEEYKEINVAAQDGVKGSVLEFWKEMIKVRKENPVLCKGGFELVDQENEEVYAYLRKGEGKEYLVACNFKELDVKWNIPVEKGRLLLGSYEGALKLVKKGK